uniref:LysM domain-containing protein n=1 Tax=Haemonchus contortus TaxID=6289 RepID=A0A7I5E8E9_HAECO
IRPISLNRMRFEFILVFPSLVSFCGAHHCHKIQFSAWDAYKNKKIRVLYDEQYIYLAEQIGCSLSTLNKANKDYLTPLQPGHKLKELCESSDFLSHASPLHLTITITEAAELEEICIPEIAALHLKKLGSKWVGHILTPRSDMIIPLSYTNKEIDENHLTLILEAVTMAWAPILFTPKGERFKSFKFFVKSIQKKLHLLPVSAIAMIFCVAIVGAFTYVARRRKAGDEQRSLQNRRAEQLSDWGQSPEPRLALPDDEQKRESLRRSPTELPALAEAVSNTDLGCTDPLLPEMEETDRT